MAEQMENSERKWEILKKNQMVLYRIKKYSIWKKEFIGDFNWILDTEADMISRIKKIGSRKYPKWTM